MNKSTQLKELSMPKIKPKAIDLAARIRQLESQAMLTTNEVFFILKISPVTLWRWRKKGVTPFWKYGQKVLFKIKDFESFINEKYINYEYNR